MDTRTTSAIDLRDAIRRGDLTAEQAVSDALARIERENPRLNAFITVDAERALARARSLDRASDTSGALHGVPVGIKDTICVRDMRATAGSRVLGDFHPPYDATVVARLEAAGAVVVGKTNCDEFAMGSSTEHSAFGPSRNPWNAEFTPGGSSGGSAVAVAAGLTPVALGSDTGGSVRQPAAFCGIVGARPTYGRVSRYGLIAFASSLDQVGPFARTVADCALVQDVIGGADPHDATCGTNDAAACASALDSPVRGLRVGVPKHLLTSGVDADVRSRVDRALDALAKQGVDIDTVELPNSQYAIPVYYLVATAEASSNLARFDGVRYGYRAKAATLDEMYTHTRRDGFGAEVKRRIMLGTYALSAGYYDEYLRQGPARAHAHSPRLRPRTGRPPRHCAAHQPDAAVSLWRTPGRPAADVSLGCVHRRPRARRIAIHQRPGGHLGAHTPRPQRGRTVSGGNPVDRTGLGRCDALSIGQSC